MPAFPSPQAPRLTVFAGPNGSGKSTVINVERVRSRVAQGGHPVNEQKIVERYHRTHQLLAQALELAHYARLFDNSAKSPIMLLEKTPSRGYVCHEPATGFPAWFVRDVMTPLRLVP